MNFKDYVGIPFKNHGRDKKGVDCYGIVVLIYKEHLGIDLPDTNTYQVPSPNYLNCFDKATKGNTEEVTVRMRHFHKLWERVEEPQPYDVITLNVPGACSADGSPTHVGMYIGEGKFIHSMISTAVAIQKLENWKPMVHGIYRYKGLELDG